MVNFDFIILIMILFCVIKGIINGLFKQTKSFLTLLIPFIFSYFLRDIIISKLLEFNFMKKIMSFLFKVFSNFLDIDLVYFTRIVIYILIFIIFYFIILILFKLFSPSIISLITKDKNKFSRIVGGVIGLANSYLLLLVVYILIDPFTNLNMNNFLSKLFFDLNGEILMNLKHF